MNLSKINNFNIPKPFSFSGNLTNVIFFFNKAKKSIIAVAIIDFFNAFKEKKNELKNRKAMWFGYTLITCLFLLFSGATQAQDLAYKNYSWISNLDTILATVTENEKKESEVILKENRIYEYAYDEEGKLFKFLTLHKVIMVNTDEGIEANNKLYIPYSNTSQVLSNKARVITKGKITELNEADIQEATDEENNRKYKYFAIEGIEKGSVIEYIYQIKYAASYSGDRILFQSDIPKKNVRVEIISPNNLFFSAKSYNGFPNLEADTTADGKNVIKAEIATIPLQKEETMAAYTANLMQLIFKLDHNTYTGKKDLISYGEISTTIYDIVFGEVTKSNLKTIKKFIKNIETLKNASSEKEKIRAVEDYVKTHIFILEQSFDGARDIDAIVSSGRSSEAGMVRLFANIYKELEIKFEVVVGCSRNEYLFDKDFEVYSFLKKYLLYFPSINQFLEPEGMFARLGFIDPLLTDNNALFVKEVTLGDFKSGIGRVKKIQPIAADLSQDNMTMDIELDVDENNIKVNFHREMTGYYAANFQPIYDFVKEDKVKEIDESLLKYINEDIEIISQTVENKGASNYVIKPFITKATFTSEHFVEKIGNKYLFKIGMLIGPQMEMYQEEERTLPIMNQFNRAYNRKLNFTIPEGYKLTNTDALNMSVKDKPTSEKAAFISSYTLENNILSVEVNEFYDQIAYPIKDYEPFRRVINAAADFNKIVIYLEKESSD